MRTKNLTARDATSTVSSTFVQCEHANGWWATIHVKFLFIFEVTKEIFICTDCQRTLNKNRTEYV